MDLGCTLVVPGRGQPATSDGDLMNWIDEGLTDERVLAAAGAGRPGNPVLIGGFSAGGRQALRIGLTGSPLTPLGLLLFGPGTLRRPIDPRPAAQRGLRVWTFVGEDDWLLREVLATNEMLRQGGVDIVERREPGVAHVVPEDLAEVVATALDFLLTGTADQDREGNNSSN